MIQDHFCHSTLPDSKGFVEVETLILIPRRRRKCSSLHNLPQSLDIDMTVYRQRTLFKEAHRRRLDKVYEMGRFRNEGMIAHNLSIPRWSCIRRIQTTKAHGDNEDLISTASRGFGNYCRPVRRNGADLTPPWVE